MSTEDHTPTVPGYDRCAISSAEPTLSAGNGGYVASLLGGLAGAAVTGRGSLLTFWIAGWFHPDPAAGMANLVMGLVFYVELAIAIPLGQVVGVGVALETRDHDGASLTAGGTAILTGVIAFVAWWGWSLPVLLAVPLTPVAARFVAAAVLRRRRPETPPNGPRR